MVLVLPFVLASENAPVNVRGLFPVKAMVLLLSVTGFTLFPYTTLFRSRKSVV